jgi:hypothetical protein
MSSVAIALETWNGSVCVTVAVGTRPIPGTTGAIRAATATASSNGPPSGWKVCGSRTRSSPRRAAVRASAT